MLKPVRHLMGAGSSLALTALLVAAARFIPDLWFSFYTGFSRRAIGAIGAFTARVPLCVWECLAGALVAAGLISLIVCLKKRRFLSWLTGLLELVCLLVFLFVGLWGLNHFAPPLSEQLGMEVGQYTQQQLADAGTYYARMASLYAAQMERDEAGDLALPEFARQSELAVESYELLAATNDRFSGAASTVKPLLLSEGFGYLGITGVYVCLTGESSVSRAEYPASLSFTMCHELAHSLAFAAEDEANFCAFLACEQSPSPILRYSGYYNAFVYCYNALHKADPAAAQTLWSACSEEVLHDCRVHVEYNQQYEGKVQDAAQKVNDTYLKAFHEEGVQSYGLVADYLIAHYLALETETGG